MTSTTWNNYWSELKVGECVERGNMQLFGLHHTLRPAIDYLTLEQAMQAGKGKEFKVEQGRWSHRPGARFGLSGKYAHSSLRYAKLAYLGKVRAAVPDGEPLAREMAYPVDQGGVWNNVQSFEMRSDAHSATSSADEVYRTFKERLSDPIEFTCPRDCSGIAVAIDGRIAGIECFDRPDTMEKVFPRLIQSYITEAMLRKVISGKGKAAADSDAEGTEAEERKSVASAVVESFLRNVAGSKVTSAPGIGMGEDLRAQSDEWSAAVLTYEERGLHGQVLLADESAPGNEPQTRIVGH